MVAALCFALSTTSFSGRSFQAPSICKSRAVSPTRISVRRARAAAVEPDAGATSESEKTVDVLESDTEATEQPSPPAPSEPAEPISDDFVERVPGKITLDEIQLAKQRTALEQYSAELRKKRLEEEREAARLFGFVPYAETLNGRLAMFFIVTGLLTEYWTGYTIPEQVELMARTLGIL